MSDDVKPGSTRRRFFFEAGAVAAATTVLACEREAEAEPPTKPEDLRKQALQHYRVLGKTGKKVSKIGLGTASLTEPAVLDMAIDMGLNYVDTAHCYQGGGSEKTLGKVLKKRRDEVVLTTKWHPRADDKRKSMLDSLDESLKRMNVEHVDCVLVHSVGSVDRIQNPEVFEAFRIAKKAGKVSHLGMSSHSPNMIPVLQEVIKQKQYELVLIKYSYLSYPNLEKIVDQLHAAGIGITVMKTRDGARDRGVKEFQKGDGFMAAALRWASSNTKIASSVMSIKTFEDVGKIAKVAGEKLSSLDVEMLEKYAEMFGGTQCRWCGECSSACPSNVPVWEVDRAAMYYDRYGDQRDGLQLYSQLGSPASGCASCAAPCESACRYGIDIRNQMMEAHDMLGDSDHYHVVG